MAFTGKATYSAGTTLPELAEDVSDLVGIVSPFETPLLDVLGDSLRAATSTHHEWLEDELLPNKDTIVEVEDNLVEVENGDRFRVGDQLQADGLGELMLATSIDDNVIEVVRGYAGTEQEPIKDGQAINILGNAAVEGGDKPVARFVRRSRLGNYTQIFTAPIKVGGDDMATSQLGLADEMNFQKQEKLRGLLRDLENAVINDGMQVKNKTVQRIMGGIISRTTSNILDVRNKEHKKPIDIETLINGMLRQIWNNSNGNIDTIVVCEERKRSMGFLSADPPFIYGSDFGVCKIAVSRWMPKDAILLLDSSRINIMPLAGRSFHFKPLASGGDYECGELIGEYTLELKNEAAHGLIKGLNIF